jgi:Ser/Thr protein kinase RdoA (MazF antagonist)
MNKTTTPALGEDALALTMAERFFPDDPTLRVQPLGQGLINETRLLTGAAGRFVLQRINCTVFADADAIAANLLRVQDWLAGHPALGIRFPRLVRVPEGAALVRDQDGCAWRLMEFVDHSRVIRPVQNLTQASEIGRTLGRFHAALAALDPGELTSTLPELHDTPLYRERLEVALHAPERSIDRQVRAALEQIDVREALLPILQLARRDGTLTAKVTHGDPKLDNVLFEEDSDRAICLVDLDTVQPGLLHHDIADCLRSCCNRSPSSGHGPTGHFDLDTGCALLGGYAEAASDLFDEDSAALLYPAIRLIPLELAMRFLADHIEGDRYFRVTHPGQNLTKAQIQLALVADIEAKQREIDALIDRCFSKRGAGHGRRRHSTPKIAQGTRLDEGEQLARAGLTLAQLAELLEGLGHPRALEVKQLADRFADDPNNVLQRINGNDWWAGAGSMAAETMAENPGIAPCAWQSEVRRFRELLIALAEVLQARLEPNPGLSSWLLAFHNWNDSNV